VRENAEALRGRGARKSNAKGSKGAKVSKKEGIKKMRVWSGQCRSRAIRAV
jgi:hypothetical protein